MINFLSKLQRKLTFLIGPSNVDVTIADMYYDAIEKERSRSNAKINKILEEYNELSKNCRHTVVKCDRCDYDMGADYHNFFDVTNDYLHFNVAIPKHLTDFRKYLRTTDGVVVRIVLCPKCGKIHRLVYDTTNHTFTRYTGHDKMISSYSSLRPLEEKLKVEYFKRINRN